MSHNHPHHDHEHTEHIHPHPHNHQRHVEATDNTPAQLHQVPIKKLSLSRREFCHISLVGLGTAVLAACGTSAIQKQGLSTLATTTSVPASTASIPGFDAFRKSVTIHADSSHFFVESYGIPDHQMMVGIRSWQQQVPTPQPYTGTNAWQIPLKGVLSDHPVSGRTALYRGAIALAVNGVPIFNALNNRGDDSYLSGELDKWGGHCGRADDYHYHIAPLSLQSIVGQQAPIAYGLDGFPLYGLTEPDGSVVTRLDSYNGHMDAKGNYHYHATMTYPYINGGMRGNVNVVGDQVDPQPQASPIRSFLQPLNGATITDFAITNANTYTLTYELNGQAYTITYVIRGNSYTFTFTDPSGQSKTETYTRHA